MRQKTGARARTRDILSSQSEASLVCFLWRVTHAPRGIPWKQKQRIRKTTSFLHAFNNMARVLPYNSAAPQTDASLLSFPEKLWWIVNYPKRGEIHWNEQGTTIVIPSTRKFVDEILNSPSSALFKTKNFSSFVRQLNLYGFRKVTEYPRRAVASTLSLSSKCEFKHTHFRKGRRGKKKCFCNLLPEARVNPGTSNCIAFYTVTLSINGTLSRLIWVAVCFNLSLLYYLYFILFCFYFATLQWHI